MQQNKIVSVIIPSKRGKVLKRCLSSLGKQKYPSQNIEIIVVTPEKREEIESISNLKIIVDEAANQAEARNIAEKTATGCILAFCDDDCVLPPDWIENALLHFSDDKVATVGGPSIPPFKDVSLSELVSGSLMISYLGTGSHKKAYVANDKATVSSCRPVNIICANMFVDRAKFKEVGGFDPIVPQEEDRLNSKFVAKGYLLVYDPKCCNIHYQRPWGFRFVRNMFWLMAGQGSLSFDRRAPSSKLYLIPPIFAIGLAASPIFLLLPVFNTVYVALVFSYLGVVVAETLRLIYQLKSDASKSIGLFFIFPFAIFVHHAVSGFGFIFGFCRRFLNKLSLTQEKKG